MALYPVLIDWKGLPCLVAGGGRIARHKAELLCAQGAAVTVVAPEFCPEILALPVTTYLRKVTAEDAEGKFLVVDATGDPSAETILSSFCLEKRIPFNSACRGEDCTAMFPAVHRSGNTLVAVSSLGASPAASAWLRDFLAGHIPVRMDEILDELAHLRQRARDWFPAQSERRSFLKRCLDAMLTNGRILRPEETEALRNDSLCPQSRTAEQGGLPVQDALCTEEGRRTVF